MSNNTNSKNKFTPQLIKPYSTFDAEGNPKPIPYVVTGLLTQGGLSAFSSKPKQGKSSFSRYEAVQITQGLPILGRDTKQGNVLLVSLEDALEHVDICLKALGYDETSSNDGQIIIVNKMPKELNAIVDALAHLFATIKDLRFVVLDTLLKILRPNDSNDTIDVMTAAERIHELAREYTNLHIQLVGHCKKVETTDPFDAMLGSTMMRAETDSNLVICNPNGSDRCIAAEGRGVHVPLTILNADVREYYGGLTIFDFSTGDEYSKIETQKKAKAEHKKSVSLAETILSYVASAANRIATFEMIDANIQGKTDTKLKTVKQLVQQKALVRLGKGVKGDPAWYRLADSATLDWWSSVNKWNGTGGIQ